MPHARETARVPGALIGQRSTVQLQREEGEWLSIAASTARMFRLGEEVREAQELGQSWGSYEPVRASFHGRIVGIQYDMWRDAVILVVAQRRGRHPRPTVNGRESHEHKQ